VGLEVSVVIGPAAFTASTTVFGLLAALSNNYQIAPIFGLFRHGVLRKGLLFVLVGNAGLALLHPLAAALVLLAVLSFLAWRIVPATSVARDTQLVTEAIEEEAAEEETQLAEDAIEEELGHAQTPSLPSGSNPSGPAELK
jgi:hypothetical protein